MTTSRLVGDYAGPLELIEKDTDGYELAALLVFLVKLRSSYFIDQLVLAAGPDMLQVVKRAETAVLGTIKVDVFEVDVEELIAALTKKAESLSTLVKLANEAGYLYAENPTASRNLHHISKVPSTLLMQLLERAADAEIVNKAKARAKDWRSSGT